MRTKEYELTHEQLAGLVEACKPVPYLMIAGLAPRAQQQESANEAWSRLGTELGFDYMTVQPVPGKPASFFTAVDLTCHGCGGSGERTYYHNEDSEIGECDLCGGTGAQA